MNETYDHPVTRRARPLRRYVGKIIHHHGLAYELWLLVGCEGARWKDLHRRLSWLAQRFLTTTVIAKTELGNFRVNTRDSAIGRDLYCRADFEFAVMSEVKTLLEKWVEQNPTQDDWMLDIRANIGVTAIPAINAGLVKRTISCEPDTCNFMLLEENARINGLADRIRAFNVAISDVDGQAELELSNVNYGDHRIRSVTQLSPAKHFEDARMTRKVKVMTVDEVVASVQKSQCIQLRLAWIDTQGHEVQVLEGGNRVFGTGLPTVLEVWPYGVLRAGKTKEAFCRCVTQYWSRLFHLETGQTQPMRAESISNLWDTLVKADAYCNVLMLN